MKNCYLPLVVLLFTLFLNAASAVETVSLSAAETIPYVDKNKESKGIDSEIVKEAFSHAGYRVNFNFRPWARVLKEVRAGFFDAAYTAYYTPEREKLFFYSHAYNKGAIVLYKRAGSQIEYTSIKDLKPYKIGVILGNNYSTEFDSADYLNKVTANKMSQSLNLLHRGRVDLIIGSYLEIKSTLSIIYPKKDHPFVLLSPAISCNNHYLIFSKKNLTNRKKVNDFNKGLKEILINGVYDKILKRNGVESKYPLWDSC